jgi:hypothetical protein
MAKKIYFSRYDNTDAVYNPGPASKFIPEWYKDAKYDFQCVSHYIRVTT